jgi:hypothetical protein
VVITATNARVLSALAVARRICTLHHFFVRVVLGMAYQVLPLAKAKAIRRDFPGKLNLCLGFSDERSVIQPDYLEEAPRW